MLLAQITGSNVSEIKTARAWGLFPDPCEPRHFKPLGFLEVRQWLDHDRATQKLVTVPAYIDGGYVYTVTVAAKSEVDIIEDRAAALRVVKARRDGLLRETDWAELPGARARIGAARADALLAYRQAVWDAVVSLVSTGGDPRTFNNWPTAP
jgi:hypothetical protein